MSGLSYIFLYGRHGNFWTFLLIGVYLFPLFFGYLYLQTLLNKQKQIVIKTAFILIAIVLFFAWTFLMMWLVIEIPQHSTIRFK
jgi:hypothetical protein